VTTESSKNNATTLSRMNFSGYVRHGTTGWPKKSKPPPIFQKIVLKIANEIRFLHKVKV